MLLAERDEITQRSPPKGVLEQAVFSLSLARGCAPIFYFLIFLVAAVILQPYYYYDIPQLVGPKFSIRRYALGRTAFNQYYFILIILVVLQI